MVVRIRQRLGPSDTRQTMVTSPIEIAIQLGEVVVTAYLTDTQVAKTLIAHLPLTTMACTGINDACGQIMPLPYQASDVQGGWFNGDICYDPSGDWFSIYTGGENAKPHLREIFLGQLANANDIKLVNSQLNGDEIPLTLSLKEGEREGNKASGIKK